MKKTVCMVFDPRQRSIIVAETFPKFQIESNYLQFVTKLKYLGHIITRNLSDDDDTQREISNLFVRINVLRSTFNKCSMAVKCVLFRSYCICLYDAALWRNHTMGAIRRLTSCYIKCIKLFFGYKGTDNVTSMLFALNLPSFNTISHNSSVVFKLHCESKNKTLNSCP